MSEQECQQLHDRITVLSVGGGTAATRVQSDWVANLRWALNRVTTCGDTHTNRVDIARSIRGARGEVIINQIDGPGVEAAVRRAERICLMSGETIWGQMTLPPSLEGLTAARTPHAHPVIWSENTYHFDPDQRADKMQQ